MVVWILGGRKFGLGGGEDHELQQPKCTGGSLEKKARLLCVLAVVISEQAASLVC